MSNINKANTDPDTVVSGVTHSNAQLEGGNRPATPDELAKALEVTLQKVSELEAVIANSKQESDSISKLADVLQKAMKPTVKAVPEQDNLNRTTDFTNKRATVDGQNMVEAQQMLSYFRNEEKMPISIPKSLASTVGADLSITVNGVRVSIPCDGHTYYINKTHWEHARERLAKIDILVSNTEPQVVTIG